MNVLNTQLKRLPIVRDSYHHLRELRDWRWAWLTDRRAHISRERIRQYQNRHAGQRCFILGNGPSLNHTDLSHLRNEYTFGSNRVYLLFPRIGFETTYLASINKHVIAQSGAELLDCDAPKFLSWHSREDVAFAEDVAFLPATYGIDFSFDPTERIYEGATITYIQMQLAFYMGFRTVYLIGVDHYFQTQGEAHKLVTSQEDDPNHFDPNYFGKGYSWQLPDLETSELAYRLARHTFEKHGRTIYDATIGGHLTLFPKVEYASLFR